MQYTKDQQTRSNRRVRKRGDRSKFSKMVRDKVKGDCNNECQMCFGKGIHLHHVHLRSAGGRGVYTNSLLVCNSCHKQIHADDALLRHWKEVYRKKYGPLYFMDQEDLTFKYMNRELSEEDKEVRDWKRHNA
jgi:hypothetical protein